MLVVAIPAALAQSSVTVPNFSFETPTLSSGTWQSAPSGGSWTFSSAGIASNGSGFTGANANAPAGSQVAYIQGNASVSQAISGFSNGTSYTVTFSAANRAGYGAQTWNLKVDGTTIKSFDPGSSATSYVDYSATFTASSSSHTIAFEGTAAYGGDVTVFVDNVRIVSAASGGTGLKGEYFGNTALTGTAALTRTDAGVDFAWNGAAPGSGVSGSNFSARWSGLVEAQYSETYTFYTMSDDGVRLWVNGVQLINNWTDHGATQDAGSITLTAGQKYEITMEYYQGSGGAQATLSWSSATQGKQVIPSTRLYPAVNGLNGDYYNTWNLSGAVIANRVDATVNFDWAGGSPASGVNSGDISVRWTGKVQPQYSETYTFYTNTDDGSRLWVNGVQLVNDYTGHAPTENSGTITLVGGQKYDIKMEYYQGGGGSVAQLKWSSPSTSKAIIPQSALYPAIPGGTPTGPNAPSNLSSNSSWNTRADVAWDRNSTDETGFKLERKTTVSGTFAQIAVIPAGWTSCIDNTVAAGTTYYYRIRATNANGDSAYSNETHVTTTGTSGSVPTAPSSLSAVSSISTRVDLGWSDNSSDETSFRLERKTGSGGTYAVIQTVPSTWTSSWDETVVANTTYYYRIAATNSYGDSSFSSEVSVTTPTGTVTTPAPPSNLSASSGSPNRVDLGWLDNSNNETGFKLERKTGSGGTYAQIQLVTADWNSTWDDTASSGTLYYYRLRATDATGDSSYSNEIGVTVYTSGTVPSTPSSLSATASSSSRITISWTDVSTETGYKIERKTGSGGTFVEVATTAANVVSYQDDHLTASTQYFYRVRATNATGDSTYSSEANATTQAAPSLGAPSSLGATAISASQINLSWTDNASGETGFKVERKLGSGGTYAQIGTAGANATSYGDTSLAASTQYYYRVRATDGGSDSSYSNEAYATTQSTGITVGIEAVPAYNVKLADPFWAPRIETNRTVSLQKLYQQLLTGDKSPQNFYKTWSGSGNHEAFAWVDSDVYKNLEGMALAVKLHESTFGNDGKDDELRSTLAGMVTDITKTQQAGGDGYIDTYIQLGVQGRANGGSYSGNRWDGAIWTHEDYCMGHMMELALAHYSLSNNSDATLLNAAKWNADYLKNNIPSNYNVIPGHQEVELALMRLYESQGRPNDLAQAKFYLDERGRHSNGRANWGEFCQDIYQIRDVYSADAHCVRGIYMWDAATRMAAATSDSALFNNMTTMWNNVATKKQYATGGMGHYKYNEGFAPDYDLDNLIAYNETCASCAMIFWSNSLGNLMGDGKYTDMVEHELYNAFASGRSLDGTRMYYNDPVSRYGAGIRGREGIVCCATNIVRTVPRIPGYQYGAKANDGVWAHLFMAGTASMSFGSTNVSLQQTTNYPWDGAVTIKVTALSGPAAFNVHVRIPAWATGMTGDVNSSSVSLTASNGYATINRTWAVNDEIHLSIPMNVRRVSMNSNVTSSLGKVAIMRGPIVYCLESTDNGTNVHNIVIPSGATINVGSYSGSDLGGIVRLSGTGINSSGGGSTSFTMIPYSVFDNRNGFANNTDLEVMIPQTTGDAVIKRTRMQEQYATVSASYYNSGAWKEALSAVNDGAMPATDDMSNSYGPNSVDRCTFWPHQGTQEWVQYDFSSNRTFNRSDMIYFNDDGGVQLPQSATVQYWNGGAWVNVTLDATYPSDAAVGSSAMNILRFNPVTTNKMRLLIQCKSGTSAGLLEWRLP